MANRESQGLQATLIVLIMLVIALMVTSYVFYRQADEASRAALAANDAAAKAKAAFADENFKVQFLKHIIGTEMVTDAEFKQLQQGVAADEGMKKIDADFQRFKDTYAQGLPAGQQFSLLSLPDILMSALRAKHETVTDRSAELVKVSKDAELFMQKEQEATQVAVDAQKKAAEDLDSERVAYNKDRSEFQKTQADQLAAYQKQLGVLRQEADVKKKEAEKLGQEKNVMEKKIGQLVGDIKELRGESFEAAHGRVVLTNQRTNRVWINLGSADGLRRQITFSVYDQQTTNFDESKSRPKGKLEVTQVLDEHLAEARIVEDEIRDPILPGDQVFSPAWRPGQRVQFAIAGFIDVNDDKISDRELIRTLILNNGGHIDAEVMDDGTYVGEILPRTRYLLIGDRPTEKSGSEVVKGFARITKEAESLGVEPLSISEFLNMIGWKGELRTTDLYGGGRLPDYGDSSKGKKDTKAAPGAAAPADAFQERTPPRGDSGAF